jgi:ribosomal protein S18 acetylase RimI-like enzyme
MSVSEPKMTYRPLTSFDFVAASAIFDAVFPAKYHLEFLDAWKLRDSNLSLGAFAEEGRGSLCGFILVGLKEGGYHIDFLGVDPTAQKGGLGTVLLRRILDVCIQRRSRATLIPVNDQRIIQWYKKHGFIEKGDPVISPYTGDIEQVMEWSSGYSMTMGSAAAPQNPAMAVMRSGPMCPEPIKA